VGRHRKTFKHPVWEFLLLLAHDAPQTGLTEQAARDLVKRWLPSMAPHVDAIAEEMGDLQFLPPELGETTFDVLNEEERAALQSLMDRRAGGETPPGQSQVRPERMPEAASGTPKAAVQAFSDQLRGELRARIDRNKIAVPD
jgi:hypothetical protein